MNTIPQQQASSQVEVHHLQPYITALERASSLNEYQAKLCVYYAILTYKIEELALFPILTLFGEHGTGKSAIMKVMAQLVNKPVPDPVDFPNLDRWQGLKINDTFPSLRDGLKENTTAFIEEGDADYKKNERLVADRYSRQTAIVRYKKEEVIGHSQAGAHIFGATIIHKRRGYKDPATSSRSMFITTKKESSEIHSIKIFAEEEKEEFRNMAQRIDIFSLPTNTRVHDLWCPLIGLATNVDDGAWCDWAIEQVQRQTMTQGSDGSFDPQKAIILAVLGRAVGEDAEENLTFSEGKYDLDRIKSDVEQHSGIQMSINEIKTGFELQGFEVKLRRGNFRVNVTADRLRRACEDLAIDDEAVTAIPRGG